MYLMNGDRAVLWFDKNDYLIKILDNNFLPYQLRDDIEDSENLHAMSEHLRNFDKLRAFFADRVLSLSRENAKAILQSLGQTQKLTQEESYQLSLRCRGLSITDNFWVKEDEEKISFSEVNLRSCLLSDAVFQISMKGTPISLQHNFLVPDVTSKGMFRKTWVKENGELFLYKSDLTSDYINTKCEIEVSKIFDKSNVQHVQYVEAEKDGVCCCRCQCFVTDEISFVEAEYVKSWVERSGAQFDQYLHENFETEFANMVVCDYLIANPDRHNNNWGFLVDNETNKVISIAPLFDHNQALIVLYIGKEQEFDNLIYPPTGITILDSLKQWATYQDLQISKIPDQLRTRLDAVQGLCKKDNNIAKTRVTKSIEFQAVNDKKL